MTGRAASRGSVLVTGGARSGKSRFVLTRALAHPPPRVFIATAEAGDAEMAARIAAHRAERGGEFMTIEEPVALAEELERATRDASVVVVDCVTLWIANLLGRGLSDAQIQDAVAAVAERVRTSPRPTILVTNEVGGGIVPFEPETRRYRDLLGAANQRLADAVDEVMLMVAGRPLTLTAR